MAGVSDRSWWRRVGSPETGFRYLDADGATPIVSETALQRIEALRIPPAWLEVRIAPDPVWGIQAWGYDGKGRRQYIYSAEHREAQSRRKWRRVLRFARVLPTLRAATDEHLKRPTLDRQKVLATVVRLMGRACFRVGGERYAVANGTFGICTLRKCHVEVRGSTLVFRYVGKRGIEHRQVIAGTPLASVVRELLSFPGRRGRWERLFRYRDEQGRVRNVTARAVNRYLREILGPDHTAKDLRTFGATLRAATILAELGPPATAREARRNVALCCRLVAAELGNTPAVCRGAYIHPAVLEEYQRAGRTIEPFMRKAPRPSERREAAYYPEEAALMRFLERYG
ncbi:MAG TPA: hypothetical protein VIL13_09430 [Longimicrobiales bacterium]